MFDYLEAGDPLGEFLDRFPTVSHEQAVAAREAAKQCLLDSADGLAATMCVLLPLFTSVGAR